MLGTARGTGRGPLSVGAGGGGGWFDLAVVSGVGVGAARAGFRVGGRETSRGVGSAAARGRRGAGSRVSAEAAGAGAGASKETRWARAAEGDDEAAFAGWVALDEGGGRGSGVPAWWEALGFDHDETEAIAGEMLESLRRGAEEEGGGRG